MTSGNFSSVIGTDKKARFKPSDWLSNKRITPSAPPTATVSLSGLNAVAKTAVPNETFASSFTPLV